jgi:hypothetical protein
MTRFKTIETRTEREFDLQLNRYFELHPQSEIINIKATTLDKYLTVYTATIQYGEED